MEYVDLGRTIASLVGVIALIFLVAWVARKIGIEKRFAGMRKDARLQIVESMYIDGRHRMVIIRRDAREHVLLVSPTNSLLVESYDATPPHA
jgi:flagellar protein FliO/FliZ